jgi:hypothetical protein
VLEPPVEITSSYISDARQRAINAGVRIVDLTTNKDSQSISMSFLIHNSDESFADSENSEIKEDSVQKDTPNAIHPDRVLRASWSLVFHSRPDTVPPQNIFSFQELNLGADKFEKSPGTDEDGAGDVPLSADKLEATRIKCPLAYPATSTKEHKLIRILISKATKPVLKLAGSGRIALYQTKGVLHDTTKKLCSLPRKEAYFISRD